MSPEGSSSRARGRSRASAQAARNGRARSSRRPDSPGGPADRCEMNIYFGAVRKFFFFVKNRDRIFELDKDI